MELPKSYLFYDEKRSHIKEKAPHGLKPRHETAQQGR